MLNVTRTQSEKDNALYAALRQCWTVPRERSCDIRILAERLMTGRVCRSVPYIVQGQLLILKTPVSGCMPSLLAPAILTLKLN